MMPFDMIVALFVIVSFYVAGVALAVSLVGEYYEEHAADVPEREWRRRRGRMQLAAAFWPVLLVVLLLRWLHNATSTWLRNGFKDGFGA